MTDLICHNPKVERSELSLRILRALARSGYAHRDNDFFVIDWNKVDFELGTDFAGAIRNIGTGSEMILRRWSREAHRPRITTPSLRTFLAPIDLHAGDVMGILISGSREIIFVERDGVRIWSKDP